MTNPKTKMVVAVIAMSLALFSGSFVFHQLENWSYLDALYFTTATMSTVGYGDLVPTTSSSKIFSIVFMIFGIGLFLFAASSIAEYYVRHQIKQFKKRNGAKTRLGSVTNNGWLKNI